MHDRKYDRKLRISALALLGVLFLPGCVGPHYPALQTGSAVAGPNDSPAPIELSTDADDDLTPIEIRSADTPDSAPSPVSEPSVSATSTASVPSHDSPDEPAVRIIGLALPHGRHFGQRRPVGPKERHQQHRGHARFVGGVERHNQCVRHVRGNTHLGCK